MIHFRWIWVSLKAKKMQSIQFVKSQKLRGWKVLHLDFNLRPWTAEFDLRGKQGPAEKISGFHELKRTVWRILLLVFKIFENENCTDYNSHSYKTLSNLNLLSQLTNLERAPWNSFTGFFSGIDSTIISIHFPISKLRACDCMFSDASWGARFRIAGH